MTEIIKLRVDEETGEISTYAVSYKEILLCSDESNEEWRKFIKAGFNPNADDAETTE